MDEFSDALIGFAETGDPGVCFDLDEDPRKIALDDGGADVGDLHERRFG